MELVRNRPPDDVFYDVRSLCGQALQRNTADGDLKPRISKAVFRIHSIKERGGSNEKDQKVLASHFERYFVLDCLVIFSVDRSKREDLE